MPSSYNFKPEPEWRKKEDNRSTGRSSNWVSAKTMSEPLWVSDVDEANGTISFTYTPVDKHAPWPGWDLEVVEPTPENREEWGEYGY